MDLLTSPKCGSMIEGLYIQISFIWSTSEAFIVKNLFETWFNITVSKSYLITCFDYFFFKIWWQSFNFSPPRIFIKIIIKLFFQIDTILK